MFRSFLVLMLLVCSNFATSGDYFYINQQQGESVSVFGRSDLSFKTRIPTLEGPAGIAINPHQPWFAVTYPEQGLISFVDSQKLIPLEHISVGGSPFGAVFAKRYLFYTDWSGNLVGVIHPGSGRIIKKIAVGQSPAGIATEPCESQVWVLNRESDSVSVINTESLDVIKTIRVGRAPFALAIDDKVAYVVNSQSNTVSVVDVVNLTEIKQIKVGRMPYGVAIDRKQRKVYVSNQLENSVSVLDAQTHKLVHVLKTGAYPENIAVDEENQHLLVLNWFDGSLSVFDTQTNTAIKRINIGAGSRAFGQFVDQPRVCAKP
ncbi:YncE family protein [methane-oxidizing endosymbiont of Gigantopelta aegis]|uniref:YncE family protein n=1 Tax=methane-oxidizing endosymbiont of Gigantopelta aegis TaxID=2794938 RepID=UPI0018DCAB5F|nr:YncE family protein [methane-oxidizing endosymbiont of Gigantopelta aegis]